MCICNDCAIENHFEHIAEAKFKLEEIFGVRGKEDWKALHIKIDNSIQNSPFGRMINDNLSAVSMNTENFVKEINFSVDSIRGKLDSFTDYLNKYKTLNTKIFQERMHASSSSNLIELNKSKKFYINLFFLFTIS
jgi:hypothetical protein